MMVRTMKRKYNIPFWTCKEEWNWDCCTSYNKCGEGEGHCDDDSECKPGLRCGTNNCRNYGSYFSSWADCCYKTATTTTAEITSSLHPSTITTCDEIQAN